MDRKVEAASSLEEFLILHRNQEGFAAMRLGRWFLRRRRCTASAVTTLNLHYIELNKIGEQTDPDTCSAGV